MRDGTRTAAAPSAPVTADEIRFSLAALRSADGLQTEVRMHPDDFAELRRVYGKHRMPPAFQSELGLFLALKVVEDIKAPRLPRHQAGATE